MANLPDAIESQLKALPEGLQNHVMRAREVGQHLARRHGADMGRVDIGIAAHDLFRATKGSELLKMADNSGLKVHPVERETPLLLHGPIASFWIEEEARLDDCEILDSVRWHTTGRQCMSLLEKVVFLADKLDPRKIAKYPYLERVDSIAQESLDEALLEYVDQNLAFLISEGILVHPASIELRNELIMEKES